MGRPAGRERGQAFTDFALAVPLILLLALGLFDAGRAVLGYTTLTNATRAGARVAIVNQSNSVDCGGTEQTFKCAAAETAVALGIPASSVPDLVVTGSDCALTGTCTVTVRMSHHIQMVTPLIDAMIGPFTLTASTTMPLERAYAS